MFKGATNLTTINGSILSTGDADWVGVTSVGSKFLDSMFTDTALTSLPAGSFNMSNITSADINYFYQTFKNNQLTREDIVQVASTRNLSTGDVNNSSSFSETFAGNSTATGLVTEDNIPQLAINPTLVKNTFIGTALKTTSANFNNR
jgi:hypothetical protein